jgi:hypothetical protein
MRSVAGYLRYLAGSIDKKATEIEGAKPTTITPKREELTALLEKYPNAVKQKLIEELGVSRAYFYRLLKEINGGRT